MLRFSIYAACAVVLSVGASAQKLALRSFHRIEGPIRDAGVLHVATGTWTRHNGNASLGAASLIGCGGNRTIVNTAREVCVTSGPATGSYFGAIDPGMTWTASARLPSTTSPNVNWNPIAAPVGSAVGSAQGCQDSYMIDGYQIAYCSDAPALATAITIKFYNQVWVGVPAAVCFNATAPAPIATHVYTNLPGQPGPAQACWAVTFDLNGAGSPNAPFAMMADGDGSYIDNTSDGFVWSFTFPSVTVSTAATGMFLGGAPSDGSSLTSIPPDHMGIGWRQFPPSTTVEAAGYDGTRFDQAPLTGAPLGGPDIQWGPLDMGIANPPLSENGSDMLGDDGFRSEGGALTPGCYFFGGPSAGPYAGFVLKLYADVCCGPGLPQDFNIDVGIAPTPTVTYSAGAGQPGTWNLWAVPPAVNAPLTDASGTLTTVTLVASGGTNFQSTINLPGATVDDLSLLSDILDPGAGAVTWTISNLALGDYDIYTYALAPDNNAFRTDVSVAGSPDPLQTVGGVGPGPYALGVTHAKHHIVVTGSPVVITTIRSAAPATNFASINGFQIVKNTTNGFAFCAGDGVDPNVTTPCGANGTGGPCLNNGAPGHGCANSVDASGGLLTATGTSNPDTIVLMGSNMPATVTCIYLQGDAANVVGTPFGDGVRCVDGMLRRLKTKINSGGASQLPNPPDGDPSISTLGLVVPGSGVVRYYQTYYRNSAGAFCPPATFNVTNGWRILW